MADSPTAQTEQEQEGLLDESSKAQGEEFSVSDALEEFGFGPFCVIQLVVACACWVSTAPVYENVTFIVDGLKQNDDFELTEETRGHLGMAMPMGMVIGCIFSFPIFDYYGRTLVLICAIWLFALLSAAISLATKWPTIFALRFLCGILLVSLDKGPVLLYVESTPASWRGRTRPLIHLGWQVGSAFNLILVAAIPVEEWRVLNLLASIPAIMLAVFATPWLLNFDSPHHQNVSGDRPLALSSLQFMAKWNNSQMPKGRLEKAHVPANQDMSHYFNRLMSVFHPNLARANFFFLSMVVCISSSNYLLWLYLSEHLETLKLGDSVATIYSAAPIAKFLTVLVCAGLGDRVGRARMLQVGFVIAAVSCLICIHVETVELQWLGLFIINVGFEFVWVALYTLGPELYPTTLRAVLLTVQTAITSLSDASAAMIGSELSKADTAFPIWFAVGMCVIGFCLSVPLTRYDHPGIPLLDSVDDLLTPNTSTRTSGEEE